MSLLCHASQRVTHWLQRLATTLFLAAVLGASAAGADSSAFKTITDGAYHYQIGPAPTWVESEPMPKLWPKDFASDAAFRVWRLDLQWHLEHGEYVDYAWEATTTKSVEFAGQYGIEFDPSWQELIIHEITRTRAGRQVDLSGEEGVLTLARREKSFEAVGFSGRVSALLVVPSVQPGDVLRVRYSTLGQHPLLKSTAPLRGYYLESQNPVLERRIRVYGKNLQYDYSEGAELLASGAKKNFLERGQFSLNENRLALDLRNGEPRPWPDQMPAYLSAWAELHVAQKSNWGDIAAWGSELFDLDHLPEHKEFKSLVQKIANQAGTDPKSRALAATRYVQDQIRYFAVHMGESTHRPHPVSEVLKRGYGDCKDKSQLLTQLLRALGIPAYPALVHSQMGPRLKHLPPSAASFDHAIVMLEIDGKSHWVDATRTQQGGHLDGAGFPDFSYALVLRDKTTALSQMLPPKTSEDLIDVDEQFQVSKALSTTLTALSHYRGKNAEMMRATRAETGDEHMRKEYEKSYARMYSDVEKSRLSVVDQREKNLLSATELYDFEGLWQSSNNWLYADFFAHALAAPLRLPENTQRTAPLAIRFPNQIAHTLTIALPASLEAPEAPSDIEIKDPAFHFRRSVTHENGILQVQFEYQAMRNSVQKDISSHIRNRRRALDALSFRYALRQSTPSSQRQERMRKLVESLEQ